MEKKKITITFKIIIIKKSNHSVGCRDGVGGGLTVGQWKIPGDCINFSPLIWPGNFLLIASPLSFGQGGVVKRPLLTASLGW